MTLGERIFELRSREKMSQGELAEKMNVSRQSISKWETDGSVPELDKLILLSDIFGITLDELVKGESFSKKQEKEAQKEEVQKAEIQKEEAQKEEVQTEETQKGETQTEEKQKPMGIQKTIGLILLGIGLLSLLFSVLFGMSFIIFGVEFIICGMICLLAKKHAGLIVGWTLMLQVLFLLPYFTGIRLFGVFKAIIYRNAMSINHIMAFVIWALLILLIVFTVRVFREKIKGQS
ncbi:MAG: helix-turn-helix domain-containing protein [Firmicutes bacterium]|nr:helix-turn-helix domain-containing protein [Bacillota bacterium]